MKGSAVVAIGVGRSCVGRDNSACQLYPVFGSPPRKALRISLIWRMHDLLHPVTFVSKIPKEGRRMGARSWDEVNEHFE